MRSRRSLDTATTDIAPPKPTARAALPFAVVAMLGLGSTFLPPYAENGAVKPFVLILAFLITLGFFVVSLTRTERSWLDPVGPWLFFLVLALGRDLSGGATSGLAPLAALPIVWLSLLGTRRDLVVATFLTGATFLVPILLVGAPAYPVGDWRRAVLWVAVAAMIGPVIQQLVRQLSVETLKQREASAELDGIMGGARLSSLITTDVSGTVRSFSVGAEELLGYRAHDVIGLGHALFHDPEEVTQVAAELGVEPGFAVFAELARRGAPSRIWTYARADGQRILVQLVVTDLRDSHGEVTGYLGVAIDATDAVQAERALTLAEARWRVVMDHLPDTTVMVVDDALQIRAVAGAGALRVGLQGTVGKSLGDVSRAENVTLLRGLLDEAFEGREASAELAATHGGAEQVIVVTPLPPDTDGARALILGRDISKERARERALVQAKERAERLFNDAPYGVAVISTSGRVVQLNSALNSMSGIIPGSLDGQPLAVLSRPGDDQLERHLATVLDDRGARVQSDWTLRDAHGNDIHVALSSRVLAEEDASEDVVLVNVVDVSERRRYEQRLAHLADHDALTGLANRRRFDGELRRHLEQCRRYGPRGALLLLDLDHFKEVNDTLGHGAGDQLIISTAALLQRGIRATDVVARLGGDEFAILLTDGDRSAAETVARSVVERVREHTATLEGTRRRVTASVGVVTFQGASEQGADVLALADMTMYDAKDAGRDGYVVLDEVNHRQPRSGARLQWKGRIEEALENDDFVLHLQPILDLRTNTIHSAEALLRLADTDELVLPGRFLYIAERAGLVPAVDVWVLKRSIAMLAELRRHQPDFQLEVNLSGLSIGKPEIGLAITESLRYHGVDPSALILEITETAAVADVEVARRFAERMTRLGCKFALDDFGAGFGSFYYLKHLLFDYVKIDGEFVADCHRSSVDRTILRSIVGIARDLGKRTVAEFVADAAALDVVRAEGVDLAQGYLIGEPVPFEEFTSRFLSGAPLPSLTD
ncbi:MAG: EAL domain-containing protein [Nocardioides sp.]|nr:EAL domain-containing protein [Nocardioides sp.]